MEYAKIISKLRELAGIPQQLSEIRQSIEKQGEATRTAYERKQQEDKEQWRRVEVRFEDQEIRKGQTAFCAVLPCNRAEAIGEN